MPNLLIYGATGYTGRLATQHAQQLGLDIVVGGRSETIKTFAFQFYLPYRLFELHGEGVCRGREEGCWLGL
jgi:short subunit dehydrogenase-like uncharacterized protein